VDFHSYCRQILDHNDWLFLWISTVTVDKFWTITTDYFCVFSQLPYTNSGIWHRLCPQPFHSISLKIISALFIPPLDSLHSELLNIQLNNKLNKQYVVNTYKHLQTLHNPVGAYFPSLVNRMLWRGERGYLWKRTQPSLLDMYPKTCFWSVCTTGMVMWLLCRL
jgi:hypothetical protein